MTTRLLKSNRSFQSVTTTSKTIELSSLDLISIFKDATSLVGVIDLMNGAAVHAVQGQRDRYQPVDFCVGDPVLILKHYLRQGIRRIYVADLDGITKNQPDPVAIRRLAQHCCENSCFNEIIFDLGWRGCQHSDSIKLIRRINQRFDKCHWVAATEAMAEPAAISALADLVGPQRTILSLDYRERNLLGIFSDERAWVRAAASAEVDRFLVLDLASVGSSLGPMTIQACKRVSTMLAETTANLTPQIYSGGGIRSERDIELLAAAGCDRFLLATALYPDATEPPRPRISQNESFVSDQKLSSLSDR